jgi:TonB family protein
MKELLTYLAEVIVCSAALLAAYALLLERRVHFGWCRRYLTALLPLAALIPLLRIPVWPGEVITATAAPTAPIPATAWAPVPEVLPAAEPLVTPRTLLIAVYLLGAATLAGAMLREALRIRRLRRRATVTDAGRLHLVRTRERIASFSFFRSVYVWEGTPGDEMQAVLMHEASHIAHRHTAERLLMETFKALQWWNPVAWVAARRLTEAQEFEADRDVLTQGFDRERYMHTIFRQLFGYSPDIANGLRDSLTKKRFQMMTTNHTSRHALLRVAGTVPVLAGLLCAFSFTAQAARIETESGASHERVIYLLNGREVPAAEIRAAEPDALTVDRFYSSENLPAEYRDRNPELVIAFTAEEPLRHYTPIRIEGTVTHADGSPAADILLYAGAMGTHPLDAEAYPARTDAEGRFSLTGPARGSLTYASNTAENSFTRVTTYDSEGADPYRMQLEIADPDAATPQTDVDAAERTAVEHPTDATARPASAAASQPFDLKFYIRLWNKDNRGFSTDNYAAGATLRIIGTDVTTQSDSKGEATLTVTEGQVVEINYPEYYAVSVVAETARREITVTLRSESTKQSVGPIPTVDEYGVQQRPLYIIDGMEYPTNTGLTTNSVESIQLLKPEEATAKYGERGKYGAVEITTTAIDNLKHPKTASAEEAPAGQQPTPSASEDDTPFLVADEMPLFQGKDLNTFRTWVQSQIRYPAEALKRGIEGRVVLSFIVERDGSVSTIELLQSPDRILSEEARRVVSSSPKWTPGRQNGHLVRVRYMLPVDFSTPKKETAAQSTAAQKPGLASMQFEIGNLNAFRSWAMQRLRYPAGAREQQTEGSVVATFTVGRDGRVDDIRIAGKPDPQLAEEVRRVVKASPAWSPATRNGEATTVTVTLPVSFRIQGSGHPLEEVPAASATTVERIVVTAFPTPARETAPDTASATR